MTRRMSLFGLLILIISLKYCGAKSCSSNSDCSGTKICLQNKCSNCNSNSDCLLATPSTPYCQGGACVQCTLNTQCTSPSLAKCSNKVCSACGGDSDCSHISGGKSHCLGGVCVQCSSSTDCASGNTCNTTTHLCQGPACTTSGVECPAASLLPVCFGGYCSSCAADTTFCSASANFTGYLCASDGACKQCTQDTDCPLDTASKCLSSNLCGTCTDDTHCSHIVGKYKCQTGFGCVECVSSTDCSPGSTCTGNICVASPIPLKITLSTTDEPDVYIIDFPLELVSNTFVEQGIEVDLLGIDSTTYSYTIVKRSETRYEIHFTVTETIPSTMLELRYSYIPLSGSNPTISLYDAEITSKRIPYMTEGLKAAAQTMQAIGGAATVAMSATSGSILILGGNPALMWALINLIQAFYYLIFVNVDYPANVQFFLKIFTLAGLDFIPNPMEWFSPEIKDVSLPTPARFEEYDVNGLFLDNAGNMLLIWFVVFSLYGISLFLNTYLNRLSSTIPMVFGRIVGWFEWSGVLRAIITSYAEIIQAACLQIRVMTFETRLLGASSIFGVIFSAFGFAFPLLTFLLVKKFSKNTKRMSRKYAALVNEYSTKGEYPKYFTTVNLVKRLLITLTLVFLHDLPYLEIFILIGLSIATVGLMIKWKPYPTKIDNYLNIISEVLFTIIEIMIFVLIHDDHTTNFSEQDRLDIGWGLIATCGIIVLINIGATIAEQVKVIKEVWQLIKKVFQKENKKKKVTPNRPRLRELSPPALLNTSIGTPNISISSDKSFGINSPKKKTTRTKKSKEKTSFQGNQKSKIVK